MRFYVNLGNNTIVGSLSFLTPITSILSTLGDTPSLQFLFGYQYGNPVEIDGPLGLPAPGTLNEFIFGVKKPGDFDGPDITSNWNSVDEEYVFAKTNVLTITDAVISGGTTLTSPAVALFTQADVGTGISGPGIPNGATITAVTPAVAPSTSSSCTLSAASTNGALIAILAQNGALGRQPTYTVNPPLNVTSLSDLFIVDPTFLTGGDPGPRVAANQAARYALEDLEVGMVVRDTDTQQYFQVVNAGETGTSAGWTTDVTMIGTVTLAAQLTWQTGTNQESTLAFQWVINNGYNNNPPVALNVTPAYPPPDEVLQTNGVWSRAQLALSAAGDYAIAEAQPWFLGRIPFAMEAGAGAYVLNFVLSDATPLAGALLRIPIDFAATLNPTINIYDGSVEGTLLQTLSNIDANARSFLFTGGFDGANWHKETGEWII